MAAGAPCGASAGGSGLRAPPQADMAGLELASHRLGGAQRHQAGLLDGPAPATEVQGEAGRGGGLAGTGRHQDHHAADEAAEGSGGHGMDGEEPGSQRPTAAAGQGRRRRSRQPLRAPRWMGQCWCGARSCLGSAPLLTPLCVCGGVLGVPAPLSARSAQHLVLGPAANQSRRCRLSSARCPLRLDPPWSPGRVDQQVLQELPAAQQQVGQGRSGDPGFGDKVPAAVGQGGADLPELPADVGCHHGGAFAAQWPGWLHGGILQSSQRLELEMDPDLYERIEKLSIRSGRSILEIIQGLISCSFPINPAETVLGEAVS